MSRNDVLGMLPFLSDVVVADVSGAQLRAMFAHSVATLNLVSGQPVDGRFLQLSAGASIRWCVRRADTPPTVNRGDAAAGDADSPWRRVAATPRPGTWIVRRDES